MIGLHGLFLLAVIGGGVVATVMLYRRSARRPATAEAAPSSRAERLAVSLVGGGALVAAPVAVLGLVTSGISLAASATVRVDGVLLGNARFPGFLAASDAVVDAGYESAWVEVANLPGNVRWLLWFEGALPGLVALLIGVSVAWLAIALLRGAPFTRALPVMLGVVAIVIVGAGLGSQVIGAIARAETVLFLGPAEFITAHDSGNGPTEGFMGFASSLDLSPIGWGLGLALVSGAFAIGTRMQRDTRGLV